MPLRITDRLSPFQQRISSAGDGCRGPSFLVQGLTPTSRYARTVGTGKITRSCSASGSGRRSRLHYYASGRNSALTRLREELPAFRGTDLAGSDFFRCRREGMAAAGERVRPNPGFDGGIGGCASCPPASRGRAGPTQRGGTPRTGMPGYMIGFIEQQLKVLARRSPPKPTWTRSSRASSSRTSSAASR